jgi:hypothetical protein
MHTLSARGRRRVEACPVPRGVRGPLDRRRLHRSALGKAVGLVQTKPQEPRAACVRTGVAAWQLHEGPEGESVGCQPEVGLLVHEQEVVGADEVEVRVAAAVEPLVDVGPGRGVVGPGNYNVRAVRARGERLRRVDQQFPAGVLSLQPEKGTWGRASYGADACTSLI